MLSKPLAEFHDGIGARERACAGHTSGDAHASRLVISDSWKPTGNESSDKWTRKDEGRSAHGGLRRAYRNVRKVTNRNERGS